MNKLLASIALVSLSCAAHAGLKVSEAWVKSTAPGQSVAAAYMTLTADDDLELVGASSSDAGNVELHEMRMVGDVMKMRKLNGIAVKTGKAQVLAPGGYHLMLQDIKHQIKAGELVPIDLLIQDKAGNQYKVSFNVSAKDAASTGTTTALHPQ